MTIYAYFMIFVALVIVLLVIEAAAQARHEAGDR